MAPKRPSEEELEASPLPLRTRCESPTKKLRPSEEEVVEAEVAAVEPMPSSTDKPHVEVEEEAKVATPAAAEESTSTCTPKPPAYGSPVWLDIPCLDVLAAKTFYEKVFNWTFRPHPRYAPEDMQMFSFSEPAFGGFGGGLMKVDPADHKPGVGGSVLYLIVEDVDEIFEKITQAGGEVVEPGKIPEGTCGWMGKFKDVAGNIGGVYAFRKSEKEKVEEKAEEKAEEKVQEKVEEKVDEKMDEKMDEEVKETAEKEEQPKTE